MTLPTRCVECVVRGPQCFCSLSVQALESLDGLGSRLEFGRHERVLHEGSLPDHVYVLCHGTIKLTTSSREGRLLILRIAGPGDVLGLAAALRPSRYEATAETLERCEVKAIPRAGFLRFMGEFQDVGRNSAVSVAREYECAVLSARRLALSGSAGGKLASALLEWGRMATPRAQGREPIRFAMSLTHEELGQMAGISRETTTRLLAGFRAQHLVAIEGEDLVLLAPERLEAMFS